MSVEVLIRVFSDHVYPALLVLFFFGFTIFIHELGHFLAAKRRGMKIERFSIGFGPKIFGWTKNGIEYRVSWIPFGGYVALPQMSPMEAIEGKGEGAAADLPPATPVSKIIVAFAGPVMNILLAILFSCAVWWVGLPTPINPSVVGWVEPGSNEETLDIRRADRILQINGAPVKTWMDVHRAVALSLDPSVHVVFERDGKQFSHDLETKISPVLGVKTINIYPEGRPLAASLEPNSAAAAAGVRAGDRFLAVEDVPVSSVKELMDLIDKQTGKPTTLKVLRDGQMVSLVAVPVFDPVKKRGRIGVVLDENVDYELVRPGPTPVKQFTDVLRMITDTFYALSHAKETGVGPGSLSGPVGIMGGWWLEIKNGGIMRGMWFAVLLNINLALLNLLPLPILDGGHILFALIEGVRRRPLNTRFVQALSTGFAILLISFMLYVTVFDFKRFFGFRFQSSEKPSPTNDVAPSTQP